MPDPSSPSPQPLTAPDFSRARNLWARAEEQREDENAPYLDTIESLSYHVPDLLAEIDRLNRELHARRNLGVEYERLRVENIQLQEERDKYQNWYDAACAEVAEAYRARNEED